MRYARQKIGGDVYTSDVLGPLQVGRDRLVDQVLAVAVWLEELLLSVLLSALLSVLLAVLLSLLLSCLSVLSLLSVVVPFEPDFRA